MDKSAVDERAADGAADADAFVALRARGCRCALWVQYERVEVFGVAHAGCPVHDAPRGEVVEGVR